MSEKRMASRKLWTMIGGCGANILNEILGTPVPREAMEWTIGLAGTFILGQGAVDFAKAWGIR